MSNRLLRGLVPALVLAALTALPSITWAGVFIGVSVNLAPPPLPVYVQPPCPEPGYLWVPGYWAWNDGAYYWVPGTWVLPPRVGLLWTPGYWGWDGGVYLWHAGYWGPRVGFYGGVRYGFGYDGAGFVGGYWRRGVFFYNRAVVRVGPAFVTNVYYHPVVYRTTYEHVSFNGGPGGVAARPTREQMAFQRERHIGFTRMQQRQQRMAFGDRSLRADRNHGRPPIAATARPAVFHGQGAYAARAAGGPVHFAPARRARPMRPDRPSWATGQPRAARPMERNGPMRAQPNFHGPQRRFESAPQRRFENVPQRRFESAPQRRFENVPQRRFESAPQRRFENMPQRRFESAPQRRFENMPQRRFENAPQRQFEASPQNNFRDRGLRPMPRPEGRPAPPQYHQQFRPQGRPPVMRGGAREQPRGGGRPPGPPQEHRGGGRGN